MDGILAKIAAVAPLVSAIVDLLDGEEKQGVPEVVAFIGTVSPIAQRLKARFEEIRAQTEEQQPEVWAKIRDDWNAKAADWLAK